VGCVILFGFSFLGEGWRATTLYWLSKNTWASCRTCQVRIACSPIAVCRRGGSRLSRGNGEKASLSRLTKKKLLLKASASQSSSTRRLFE
jgi:hypothetical protein